MATRDPFSEKKHRHTGPYIPLDRGYGVTTPNTDPQNAKWNARLRLPHGEALYLWVHTVEASFTIEGETAQSQTYRQFFPHHFADVSLTVSGTMPNQYQYNRLAAFVRESHWQAIFARKLTNNRTQNGVVLPTTQLVVRKGRLPDGVNKRGSGVKGGHQGWRLEGYIKNIQAGSKRFENAPEFSFDYVIAQSENSGQVGIYSESLVLGHQIADWTQLFKKGFQDNTDSNGRLPPAPKPVNTPKPDPATPVNGFGNDPLAPIGL